MIKVKPALNSRVKGVFFGYSSVIEWLICSEETFSKGVSLIRELLLTKGIDVKIDELHTMLISGQENYCNWCMKNNYRELKSEEIWASFLLEIICRQKKDKDAVQTVSEKLSSIYDYYRYKRRPVKGIVEILSTLSYAGYITALVCNTISRSLIPDRLRKFNIERHFSATVLSVDVGSKKPASEIFERALRETGLDASECMHVGDSMLEDVSGSKGAMFYRSVFIRSELSEQKDMNYRGDVHPDCTIESLGEIFQIME
ncbi:MAG: HAD family hydrolase [Spirochaetota bacterium]|nr:MAG: HAD family hydrolase [Spirochaetota bacterium]